MTTKTADPKRHADLRQSEPDDTFDEHGTLQPKQVPAVVPAPVPAVPTVTPTQAKANAVSLLLAKAVDRASDLRLTKEESDSLKAPFTDDCFRSGAGGKSELIYIEHTHLRNRLDDVLGMGQWSLVMLNRWNEDQAKGVTVYFEGALIVRGCYITQSVGDMTYYPNNASQNFGDAVEGAESACLRRCAKKFGVGLQAWSKTWCEGWWTRNRNGKPQPREDGASVNDDQAELIESLLTQTGIDRAKFLAWASVKSVAEISQANFAKVRTYLESKVPADPAIAAALKEWTEFMSNDATKLDDLNKKLVGFFKLPKTVRDAVWGSVILPRATDGGLAYMPEKFQFVVKE